jgi:hypothetical protein
VSEFSAHGESRHTSYAFITLKCLLLEAGAISLIALIAMSLTVQFSPLWKQESFLLLVIVHT